MKKLVYSLLAFAAATMAFSCAKTIEEAPINEESTQKIVRTFTCTFEQPDTKLDIATNGKTKWEVGDKILIHAGTDGDEREIVTLAAGDIIEEGKKAVISTTLDPYIHYKWGTDPPERDDVSEYYAMYPADAAATGKMYYNAPFSQPNEVLMAACNVGNSFVFFQLSGVIKFQVTSGDYDSVGLVGNNDEDVSYEVYQARVRDTGDGASVTYVKPADTYKPLVAKKEARIPFAIGVNTIGIPGGANFTGGFTLYFYKDDAIVKYAKTETPVNVDHGKVLFLNDITAHIDTYVPPTSHTATHPAIAGATDLGASGTANCYIIYSNDEGNKDKVFKFKAVRGNSDELLSGIDSAVIIWETYNNNDDVTKNSVILDVDFDKQDGDDTYWVTLQMPSTLHSGNALIAVKDKSGKILWSWHIWVPSTTISAIDAGIHPTAVMSRNLGALVDTQAGESMIDVTSIGMFYQWGRKDPFPGPSVISEGYEGFGKVAGTAPTYDKVQLTVAESIQQPTLLARGGYEGSSLVDPNWCPTPDADLWGDSGSKSKYDPCPVGYRVPKREQDYSLWTKSDFTAQTGWSYNIANHWFTIGSPAVVFPVAGYYDGTIKTVYRTIIWNAHSDDYQGSKVNPHYAAYARRVKLNDDDPTIVVADRDSKYKSYGCNVRCVVE